VSYIAQRLERQGSAVEIEPKIKTDNGIRKPDLIVKMGQTALVVDAQVVNDQIDLNAAHQRKSEVYRKTEEELKQRYSVSTVRYTSVTLSWRGVWSAASAEDLLGLGTIRKDALKIISSRVIIGGLTSFHLFNKTTSVRSRSGRRIGAAATGPAS